MTYTEPCKITDIVDLYDAEQYLAYLISCRENYVIDEYELNCKLMEYTKHIISIATNYYSERGVEST